MFSCVEMESVSGKAVNEAFFDEPLGLPVFNRRKDNITVGRLPEIVFKRRPDEDVTHIVG